MTESIATRKPYVFIGALEDHPGEIKADSIVSRLVYSDDVTRVTLFGFAAGQELTEHRSTKPAVLHFISGEATVGLGEDTLEVSSNAWIHMAPNLPHSLTARTDVIMLLTIFR